MEMTRFNQSSRMRLLDQGPSNRGRPHINEIAKRSSQQQFNANTTVSAVIELLRVTHKEPDHHLHQEYQ